MADKKKKKRTYKTDHRAQLSSIFIVTTIGTIVSILPYMHVLGL